MVGTADALNVVFMARAGERTGTGQDVNEATEVFWISLDDVPARIASGDIVGAASIIGAQQVLLGARPLPAALRAGARWPAAPGEPAHRPR